MAGGAKTFQGFDLEGRRAARKGVTLRSIANGDYHEARKRMERLDDLSV